MSGNWKSQMGGMFSENGIYRLESLNSNLYNDLKEYAGQLNKFDHINATVEKTKGIMLNNGWDSSPGLMDSYNLECVMRDIAEGNMRNDVILLRVQFDMNYDLALFKGPFLMGLNFTAEGLHIKYPSDFNIGRTIVYGAKVLEAEARGVKITPDPYTWKEEKLDEPEIFEKEYLFQLINNRLDTYIKRTQEANSPKRKSS